MKVNRYSIILLLLLVGLVGTVSAETVILNATHDGFVAQSFNQTWATLRGGAGNDNGDSPIAGSNLLDVQIASSATPDYFNFLKNGLITFDTSSLPDDATITSATVSLSGHWKTNGNTGTAFAASIVDATPTDPTNYANEDYTQTSLTRQANDIAYASVNTTSDAYNNFTLTNTTFINKTGKTSYTLTSSNFVDNTSATWVINQFSWYQWGSTNSSFIPQLTITYTGTTATYPVTTINETMILPNSDTTLPPTGLNMSINGSAGQYKAVSFVIKPNAPVTDIQITTTALSDADGTGHAAIPNSSIDVRTVKAWYKPTQTEIYYTTENYLLTPELLLKNDSLIRVDTTAQTNEIWVKNATFEGYWHLDNTTIDEGFYDDYAVYDNATASGDIQPLSLATNENRQIWMTIKIPTAQAHGNYTGSIYANSTGTTSVKMNLTVRVLPFALVNSTLDHGMYYQAQLKTVDPTPFTLTETYKTEAQYLLELQDMKAHGVMYPKVANGWSDTPGHADNTKFNKTLELRNTAGYTSGSIYLANSLIHGEFQTVADSLHMNLLGSRVVTLRGVTGTYGFDYVYGYGLDEPSVANAYLEETSFGVVRNNGSGTYFADNNNIITNADIAHVAPYTSIILSPNAINNTRANLWQAQGSKVYSYNNPKFGVPNPEIYRTNYGNALWVSDYDGEFNFAYQQAFGDSIWNPYDSPLYSGTYYYVEHSCTYPTTNGIVPTIQWEGYREGVDDSRYADTLSYITGNETEATTIINDGIADGDDMSVIRAHIIDHILAYGDAVHPTASFTKSRSIVRIPQTVTFTDTSTNTPTSWAWYWFDNETVSNTTQNPTDVSFTTVGTANIRLNASNAAGSDWSNDTLEVQAAESYGTGTSGAMSSQGVTVAIVGALTLVGVLLLGAGTVLIIGMFRGGTMGRGGVATSPEGMGMGIAAITVGALLLFVAYVVLSPIFVVAGA